MTATLPSPNFDAPPLVEVALSAQFEPLESLGTAQFGLLWTEFRSELPKVEEHPPIEPSTEEFTLRVSQRPKIQFEHLDSFPAPRVWFMNKDGTALIQVQQTRFIRNWRKVGSGDSYPRYEHIRQKFGQELETFGGFVKREELGELVFNQCELTYVNHIIQGEGWDLHGQLGQVVRLWCSPQGGILPQAENIDFKTRYVIQEGNGLPLGRLHVAVESAYRVSDKKPIFILTLIARGKPLGTGNDGLMAFLDLGHSWIVRAFAEITTPAMHKIWRRRDELES